jgi:hypothetical protein
MPSDDDIRVFINVISSKYPTLADCWGAMDGLPIQKAGDDVIQSYFYNGWKCSHYVACLFLFTPDGHIVHSYTNAPGTTHDSTMAIYSKIYEEADAVYARMNGRARIVVDSAFSSTGRPSLITSYQNLNNQHHNRALNNEATAVRQMSEWGMRGFQSLFPRQKKQIIYEARGERKIRLMLFTLLYYYVIEFRNYS